MFRPSPYVTANPAMPTNQNGVIYELKKDQKRKNDTVTFLKWAELRIR